MKRQSPKSTLGMRDRLAADHLLRVAEASLDSGDLNSATRLCAEVISKDPANARALQILGVVAGVAGHYQEAVKHFKGAMIYDPKNPSVHFNLAKALADQGMHGEAIGWAEKAVNLDPANKFYWLGLGEYRFALNDLRGAVSAYEKALRIDPNFLAALNNKACCQLVLGELEDAHALARLVTSIDPDNMSGWNTMSSVLSALGRHEEALQVINLIIERHPGNSIAWQNRGAELRELSRYSDALASYDRAIEIEPDNHVLWSNKGVAMNDLIRHEEALHCFSISLKLSPNDPETWVNQGVTLQDLHRYTESADCFERALEISPNHADAQYQRGLLRLKTKNLSLGFTDYLRRWDTKGFSRDTSVCKTPRCTPGDCGEHLFISAEQGIGDEIFYASFFRELTKSFGKVTVAADSRLHRLYTRSFPNCTVVERCSVYGEDFLRQFSHHMPIGDAGYVLSGKLKDLLSSRTPYLLANEGLSQVIRTSLPFEKVGLVCGVSWRSTNERVGEEKSIPLQEFSRVLSNFKGHLVSLQYGDVVQELQTLEYRTGIRVHQLENSDHFNDLERLASTIAICDFVITSSNVTAHIAGALGKPGYVIVPWSRGRMWYWHVDEVMSCWYPSLRVIYKDDIHTWTGSVEQLTRLMELDFRAA